MGYDDERENFLGHRGIVSDDDIGARLESLSIGPSTDAIDAGSLQQESAPDIIQSGTAPDRIVAVDGSRSEVDVGDQRREARVGFVEVSVVDVDIARLGKRGARDRRFVAPDVESEAVDAEHIRLVLPSQNTHFEGELPMPLGFREMLYRHFRDEGIRGTPLLDILERLFEASDMVTGGQVMLRNCPYHDRHGCTRTHEVPVDSPGRCDSTDRPLYPTDRLRIHEYVSNHSSNVSALTVLMKTIEHLALALAIEADTKSTLESETWERTAFLKDGPLAQFDTAAWISRAMCDYLHGLSQDRRPVVVGLDKSGEFTTFGEEIREDLPSETVVPLSSEEIYDRVKPRSSTEMFGRKTYYGKSFLYKTAADYLFCLTVGPREFAGPATNGVDAGEKHRFLKHDPSDYPTLGSALATISAAELALYRDSLIPIHMAHDRATIPENVGDKVLSELAEHELLGADRVYGR